MLERACRKLRNRFSGRPGCRIRVLRKQVKELEGTIRHIQKDELLQLLELYQHLNSDDPPLMITSDIENLWNGILNDPNLHYLVAVKNGQLISSCTLAIIKNLTRNARPYGLIENVVTHESYRNQGYGTALLRKAVEIAKNVGCYKVMLMTGRKEESTLNFYEKAGFHKGEKTAFLIRFT
jgi:GNAT superfamily N-acetyltransferase